MKSLQTVVHLILSILVFVSCVPALNASVSLPSVFGNDMVLQRDLPIIIWGGAEPGEKITVAFGNTQAQVLTDAGGDWRVQLPPAKAGGPFMLRIQGTTTVEISNVMIGEVWLCCGDESLAWDVAASLNKDQEIASAQYPAIRLFRPQAQSSGLPASDIDGTWRVCSPDSIRNASAVSYYFARELYRKLGVAVGVITVSCPCRIDQFTPAAAFKLYPQFANVVKRIEDADRTYALGYAETLERLAAFIPQARVDLAKGRRVEAPPEHHHDMESSAQTSLFNGSIAPLLPMSIRGVIWDQGRYNWNNGSEYALCLEIFIRGWRAAWTREDLPFYYVQLPPHRYDASNPTLVPEFWQAQASGMALPHTGMAILNDLPHEENQIHDSQAVGRRLALWALGRTYGQSVVYSGPQYASFSIAGGKILITFTTADGLAARDGKDLTWFTIAGADHKFLPAEARIVGQIVQVSAPGLEAPLAVRFAWDQEAQPNLINAAGLPTAPFRTDDWALR